MPLFVGSCITATVCNTSYSDALWMEIKETCRNIRERFTLDAVKEIPAIAATREIYKYVERILHDTVLRRRLSCAGSFKAKACINVIRWLTLQIWQAWFPAIVWGLLILISFTVTLWFGDRTRRRTIWRHWSRYAQYIGIACLSWQWRRSRDTDKWQWKN